MAAIVPTAHRATETGLANRSWVRMRQIAIATVDSVATGFAVPPNPAEHASTIVIRAVSVAMVGATIRPRDPAKERMKIAQIAGWVRIATIAAGTACQPATMITAIGQPTGLGATR